MEVLFFVDANFRPVRYQVFEERRLVFESELTQATDRFPLDPSSLSQSSSEWEVEHKLGCIVDLLASSAYHQKMTLGAYLEEDVLPPLRLDYFRVFYHEVPVGLVTWGFVDERRLAEILTGQSTITSDDWDSGNRLMIHDVVTAKGHLGKVMRHMKSEVFPDQVGFSIRRAADGSIQRVNRWKGKDIEPTKN
jgi:hemolysin-activating ACP:hemolysin acyltransferase